jgi:hypothetical protein
MEYERLRSQIVGAVPRGIRRGVGLALLLREGMPAWMYAVRAASAPFSRAQAATTPPVIDDRAGVRAVVAGTPAPLVGIITPAQHDDVARVLAGLVLSTCGRHRSVPSEGASA